MSGRSLTSVANLLLRLQQALPLNWPQVSEHAKGRDRADMLFSWACLKLTVNPKHVDAELEALLASLDDGEELQP